MATPGATRPRDVRPWIDAPLDWAPRCLEIILGERVCGLRQPVELPGPLPAATLVDTVRRTADEQLDSAQVIVRALHQTYSHPPNEVGDPRWAVGMKNIQASAEKDARLRLQDLFAVLAEGVGRCMRSCYRFDLARLNSMWSLEIGGQVSASQPQLFTTVIPLPWLTLEW